ncbi:hypothetical protein TanjilG_19196 [Lupinus angustifolius]|uniref:Uncharacterized protein n=1 Tax=Lupinus angustifolius TaxID=3871 RepID=A0A1J7GJY1_LUPAN|nr:hypothetical protein TanjilG_19196 [Lupinus angustifolius]
MVNQATSIDLKELVKKFILGCIGKEIEKATCGKVKILKASKFDLCKLMDVQWSDFDLF